MENPFKNDPLAMVWQAFQNLYPDKQCECWFDVIDAEDADGNSVTGVTGFSGNESEVPMVFVHAGLRLSDAIEVFAHELAHVAAGEDADHGKEWEDAFDALFNEYNRIGDEMFDEHKPVDSVNGKALYVEDE